MICFYQQKFNFSICLNPLYIYHTFKNTNYRGPTIKLENLQLLKTLLLEENDLAALWYVTSSEDVNNFTTKNFRSYFKSSFMVKKLYKVSHQRFSGH
jgi:hypothetical protein